MSNINIKKKEENIVVVENGINTCYISSLLVALFYTPSNIYYKMLESDPLDQNLYYLQELIKINFIEPLRKNISVSADIINEIRNYMFINGWKTDLPDELLEQQDISELYLYFLNNFDSENLTSIIKEPVTNDNHEKEENVTPYIIPFIDLSLPKENKDMVEINIQELISNWLNNITEVKGEVNKNNKELSTFKISNISYIFPVSINRFVGGKKNNTPIDIKYQIKPFNGLKNFNNAKWSIHSIICHTGKDIRNSHYYTVLLHNDKWMIFDDQSVPSLSFVDMKSDILKTKVKSESIFIIYKYDELSF
jgi:uncharacterized UBP type Zn finger protein